VLSFKSFASFNLLGENMLKIIFLLVLFMSSPLFATYDILIAQALEARTHSYSPYSQYAVGAALLTADGEYIQGCNVENSSYGLTLCAERAAIMAAVSQGKKEFEAIAIATKDGGAPCGACRQVLNEFNPQMQVITVNEEGKITQQTTLDKLLPQAFGPHNLE
jgi:cytidine deaminase